MSGGLMAFQNPTVSLASIWKQNFKEWQNQKAHKRRIKGALKAHDGAKGATLAQKAQMRAHGQTFLVCLFFYV